MIASVAIFVWAKLTGQSFSIKKDSFRKLLIITLFFTANLSLYVLGINTISASKATLLINVQPFCVLILAHLFIADDKISFRKTLGMIIGFVGVASLFIFKKDMTADFQLGDIMVLFGAFFWACNTVYIKTVINEFKSFHIVLYPMVLSIPIFLLESILWDSVQIKTINLEATIALLYQGLVTTSFGFIAWNSLLKRYKATSLHSFVFIIPISGVLFGRIILNEYLTANILVALFLTVSGIIIVHH
mmetsp:Transcript_22997/g.11120  ORF Transcript_22997/g.11120 Transcript_22997/m.11120 type:complete len:246 (-) Transcript_22997:1795-2532(-)